MRTTPGPSAPGDRYLSCSLDARLFRSPFAAMPSLSAPPREVFPDVTYT